MSSPSASVMPAPSSPATRAAARTMSCGALSPSRSRRPCRPLERLRGGLELCRELLLRGHLVRYHRLAPTLVCCRGGSSGDALQGRQDVTRKSEVPMNPDDEPRQTQEREATRDDLPRLERTVAELSRNTAELARTVNETLAMLVERVEAIEQAVFPAGAAEVH